VQGYHALSIQKKGMMPSMGVGRIFSRGWPKADFPGVAKDFSMAGQNGEISFYPLETKKTTFLLKS